MANFLITGARSPAALELTRNLAQHKHQIFTADCLHFPLTRYSRYTKQNYQVTAPNQNLVQFKTDLLNIIQQQNIDYLVPTCEEVFYIALIKDELERHCHTICAEAEMLTKAHSKYQILTLAKGCGIELPETDLVDSTKLLKTAAALKDNKVIKREYSRFGTGVLLNPNKKTIKELINTGNPKSLYLIQEKIRGKGLCCYSIANNGVLTAHMTYRPQYQIKNSASIYFSPESNHTIEKFVSNFVKKHQFSGQISFDFIENDKKIVLIECNPRATSGIHLFNNSNIANAILGVSLIKVDTTCKPAMSSTAMILNALPQAILKGQIVQWLRSYTDAREIIASKTDPILFFSQYLSFAEIISHAIRSQGSIRDASTYGIHYNDDINETPDV